VITVILAKKAVAFSLIKALRTPLIASTLLLVFLVLLRGSLNSIEGIIVVSVLSAILYALACFLLEGKQLIEEGLSLFKARHA